MNVDKIFERATIRGVADYLLFGLGPDEDDRSYEERLDEIYMRFEKAVGKYDENPTSELLDLCNELSSETASVYMEIGLQAGILLMVDMVRNMTDFCESFVYENDSATVSDLAELYNKGIFSYDIKIKSLTGFQTANIHLHYL